MTLQPSLFDQPGTPPDIQQASPASIRSDAETSPARVRSLAGILLGFSGIANHSITAAKRAHVEQVAAEALAKIQAGS